ncbi:hypothetical protein AB0L70_23700 [Kribbella sp. NPDC051952]
MDDRVWPSEDRRAADGPWWTDAADRELGALAWPEIVRVLAA